MFDLVIIGGGPAGCSAGVYAARKQLHTAMVVEEFGGQSVVSPDVHNWIGEQSIPGHELGKKLENHVRSYESDIFQILTGHKVKSITKSADHFIISYGNDSEDVKTLDTKTILITTGSRRRKLDIPGADQFENKGVVYCASCDGPLFSGLDVAVIGGGNAGFESAAQLLAYTNSVTLLHRRDEYKADSITVEKVLATPKMTGILNAEPIRILGDKFVSGLEYRDIVTNDTFTIPVMGIFVEIGAIPNTKFAENIVDTNQLGYIEIDPWSQKTKTEGVWAAGDCTNVKYHQNNIAAGDAVKAVEDIYYYLNI